MFTGLGGPDEHWRSEMRSALSHRKIEMHFVLWSDLSVAESSASGLMILTIKQLLMSPLNEEKIVLSLRAKHPLRGIAARSRQVEIRAAIGETVEDVTEADSPTRSTFRGDHRSPAQSFP